MRWTRLRVGIACAAVLVIVVALVVLFTRTSEQPSPGTAVERSLGVYAAAGLLNGRVLASRSATATLETWCGDHQLAQPATVVATRATGEDKPPTAEQRAALKVGPGEPVRYRKVTLSCGERTLSQAENWYVPGRLDPRMNVELDTTDIPFGKVVAALNPARTTSEATLLWQVLPTGWENSDPAALRDWAARNQDVLRHDETRGMFRHVAALTREIDDLPIALVHETYTMGALHFITTR